MVTSGCSFYLSCKSEHNTQGTASIPNKCRQIYNVLLAPIKPQSSTKKKIRLSSKT